MSHSASAAIAEALRLSDKALQYCFAHDGDLPSFIQKCLNKCKDSKLGFRKSIELELASSCLYIMKLNGRITKRAAQEMNELVGIGCGDICTVRDFAFDPLWVPDDFPDSIPYSFYIAVDLELFARDDFSGYTEKIIEAHKAAMMSMAASDFRITKREEQAIAGYCNMLRSYWEAQRDDNQQIHEGAGDISSKSLSDSLNELSQALEQLQEKKTISVSDKAIRLVLKRFMKFMEDIDTIVPRESQQTSSTIEIAKAELFDFIAFLADSDGTIHADELAFIEQFLGYSLTEKDVHRHLAQNFISGRNFIEKVPYSFWKSIEYDNTNAAEEKSLSLSYIGVFKLLGTQFIACDGHTDATEASNLTDYIRTLTEYRGSMLTEKQKEQELLNIQEIIDHDASGVKELEDLMDELNGLTGMNDV